MAANFECGSAVRFELVVREGRIEPNYASNGCGYMLAAADVLDEYVRGRELTGLEGLVSDRLEELIKDVVGDIPDARFGCVAAAVEALRSAFADMRRRRVEEFTGERALICTCFGVSEQTIEQLIAERGLVTVAGVRSACRAGSGCGACTFLIQEMLDTAA